MRSDHISDNENGCWPTRSQVVLLQAALLEGEKAIDAWRKWISTVNIDRIDTGSRRLLPLLYRNLRRHGIVHPSMNMFKGIYRLTWFQNQLLFRNVTELLRSFNDASIRTVVLKGAALTVLYYKDYGLRPMYDFDILVPTAQAATAINMLKKLNWTSQYVSPDKLTQRYISFRHAHPFKNASGENLDLHWHVVYTCLEANADDEFWDAAIPVRICDVPTFVLNPADQLLHVCAHGAWWAPVPPLRWVADAMAILKHFPDIDWNRLVSQAQKCHLVLPIRETLSYLHETLDVSVPPSILQHLHSLPVPKAERIEYKALACPNDLRGPFLELWLHYSQYSRSNRAAGLVRRIAGFPRFLQLAWRIDHLWQIPFYLVSRGLRRIWNITLCHKNKFASAVLQK